MTLIKNITLCLLIFSNNHTNCIYTIVASEKKTFQKKSVTQSCLTNRYLIKRLKQTIILFHKAPKKLMQNIPLSELHCTNNPIIVHYIKKIKKEKSFKPFFNLWHKICTCQIIADESFFTDFLCLICTLLYAIKEKTLEALNKKNYTPNTIVSISQKIDRLPLAEILNIIDMLTHELPEFFEKYELNSSITWRDWFKKYWWVPPVFTVWFGLKILIKFQNKPHYFALGYYPQQVIPTPIVTNDPALLEIMSTKNSLKNK